MVGVLDDEEVDSAVVGEGPDLGKSGGEPVGADGGADGIDRGAPAVCELAVEVRRDHLGEDGQWTRRIRSNRGGEATGVGAGGDIAVGAPLVPHHEDRPMVSAT